MPQPKVFIFAVADSSGEAQTTLTDAGCELALGDASWHTPMGDNEDTMCVMAEGAVALTGTSIRSSPISRRIMEISPDLRIVAKTTIGVDDVDVEAATDLGILVTHAPTESNWGGVAEGTMAMMLTLGKRIREKDERVKGGQWRDLDHQGTFFGRRHDGYPGITIGFVGLGRIASRVADMLAPWRVRLLAYDPYQDLDRFVLHNVEKVDFDTLLAESDIVSLHVVLTPETTHMIGRDQLARMKPTASLINTSRGRVIDQVALVEALNGGGIASAALDVFEDEPLPKGSPILELGHKVLLSPHMVSSNLGSGLRPGVRWATRSVLTAIGGEVPDNVYNKEVVRRWLERFGGRNLLEKSAA